MIRCREARAASYWAMAILALILLLVMHLMMVNTGGSGADMPEPLLVWCAISLLIAGSAWLFRCSQLQSSAFLRTIIFAAVLLTLPLCWSPSVDWRVDALPRLAGLWAGVALYYFLLNCRLTAVQQQLILGCIAFAAVVQALVSLAGIACPMLLPLSAQQAVLNAPGVALGVFQQRNVTASLVATGAAVLLWLLGEARFTLGSTAWEKWRRCGIGVAIVLLYMTLVLLKSRVGWLGGLSVWGIFIALFCLSAARRDCSPYLRGGVVLLPLLGILLGQQFLAGAVVAALHEHDASTFDRLFILQHTWQMIAQHPMVGWGYGGFSWSFAHFLVDHGIPLTRGVYGLSHPHNDVLFWWVEGGIVALGGLLVMAYGGVKLLLTKTCAKKWAILGCLVPILMHTQLEYPLYQSPVHWLLVLLLLNMADTPQPQEKRVLFHARRMHFTHCIVMVLACMGALLTAATFWQGFSLTAFQLSPQLQASQVISMHEWGIGIERLRKDRALSYIVRYQSDGNVDDLHQFDRMATRWLKTWCDADMDNNLINVRQFLGNNEGALKLKREAHHLYPEDPRFSV
ncbi:PglL family O-oligosaccharyltransferase [Kluyvera sichuanensis]|uniref:PglL family O-oligosaccharyltransferase n=1 Tax=Kluyvera sichuanensis TaxID=2725494 RepID=UPI002FD1036A